MRSNILGNAAWTFIKKYRVTALLWLTLLVFGMASYTTFLKREGFPDVAVPVGVISGTYFINDAGVVDEEAVQPLTRAIEDISVVEEYQAASGPNFFSITTTFSEETSSQAGVDSVRDAVANVSLPSGVSLEYTAIEPAKINNRYSLLLSVYDQNAEYELLQEKASNLVDSLVNLDDVKRAEVIPVIETVTDPSTGQQVDRQTAVSKIYPDNSEQFYKSVNIGVVRSDDSDDVQVSHVVDEFLQSSQSQAVLGQSEATIAADFATGIEEQIQSLQNNLLGGLAAVVIVSLLLISWRAALVIALFIPTVLATTFLGLGLFGLTLNTITLFATILTLGLFVDDATIVVESIDAHRKDRTGPEPIIKGALQRIGIATIAGTLTTILVFAPMLFVSGILGDFIRLLPITVILALAVSLVISIIIVPFLARGVVLGGPRLRLLDGLSFLVPLERRVGSALASLPMLVRKKSTRGKIIRILMLELSVLMLIGAGIFAYQLPFEIFPQPSDGNFIRVNIQYDPNTSIEAAENVTNTIDQHLLDTAREEIEGVTYLQANERGATLQVDLTDYSARDVSAPELVERLAVTSPSLDIADVEYSQVSAGPPKQDFPFQIRLYAAPENLGRASQAVGEFIQNVSLEDIKVEEVRINPNGTVNRTANGRFVDISARFSSEESVSGNVMVLENEVQQMFVQTRQTRLGIQDIDYEVSQESDNAESFSSVGVGMAVALVAMYFLLIMLFDSFLQPVLILLAVPFSLFGVFGGLYISGNSLSFFSMLGIMGLIGIAVNNSIMLTEFANQERAKGAGRHKAISQALKDRFRALITTTLTTIFALTPLALSDPFWQPLAYTIIFGLLSSTLFIVTSFPFYYLAIERMRDRLHRS